MGYCEQTKLANLGELDALARFSAWHYFCSLTYCGVEPSESVARKLVFAHLYRTARLLDTPFRGLAWVLRVERGERTGRLHYHALIGGARKTPCLSLCFRLNALWDALPRCGHARHRLFDYHQNGASYVASCLSSEGTLGADFYESKKFGTVGCDVTLSNSLVRAIAGRKSDVDRCVHRSECGKKRRQRQAIVPVRQWAIYQTRTFDYDAVKMV